MQIYRLPVFILFTLAMLALTACSQPRNYRYFMLHPKAIGKALQRCQAGDASSAHQEHCMAVQRAYTDVSYLLAHAKRDAQAFGMQIIQAQIKLAKTKTQMLTLKQALQTLQAVNSTKNKQKISALQNKLKQTKKQVDNQTFTVNKLLAIISLQGI